MPKKNKTTKLSNRELIEKIQHSHLHLKWMSADKFFERLGKINWKKFTINSKHLQRFTLINGTPDIRWESRCHRLDSQGATR